MRNTKFTTKEEYLQYRSDWKRDYKQLSQDIIRQKNISKESSRLYNTAYKIVPDGVGNRWFAVYHKVQELMKITETYQNLVSGFKWKLNLRQQATVMLEELKLAKIEAGRQYEIQKSQIEA